MRGDDANKNTGVSSLPSVDEVLNAASELAVEFGRERVTDMVRSLIAKKRAELLESGRPDAGLDRTAIIAAIAAELAVAARAERRSGVRRVINATGVVIHTNLGRAPLSASAMDAMRAAAGYSSIEYDIAKGSRGARGSRAVDLLKRVTGAEDALAVNNCAAAALLVLSVFAQAGEVIVSRGELVEIGGDFRIPDILTRSGAVLREVGTTNRTHLRDYEAAVSDRTAMILKVHPSNFRITGFTAAPSTAELAALAREKSLIFFEDAGSGALLDLGRLGVKGEPVIRDVIAAGADLAAFSGDKLLGGPQAGIIAGRSDLIERLRRDPFYRALRLDKTITAALEATLDAYVRGTAEEEVPVLRMLSAPAEEMAARSTKFAERLGQRLNDGQRSSIALDTANSAVGGGAAPDSAPETTVIALTHARFTDSEIAERLRVADTPVIARIESGRVLLDLRTVAPSEEDELIDSVSGLFRSG